MPRPPGGQCRPAPALSRSRPRACQNPSPQQPRPHCASFEVHAATGLPQSLHQARSRRDSPYRLCILGSTPRTGFCSIGASTAGRLMAEMGLVEEVARLRRPALAHRHPRPLAIRSLSLFRWRKKSSAVLRPKGHRRYAKRQLTWWRRDSRVRWLAIDRLTPEQLRRQALVLASDHDSYI